MLATYDLLVFATIAEEGSFSRAAMKLHLAQPSISEKVVRLERQLGVSLFVIEYSAPPYEFASLVPWMTWRDDHNRARLDMRTLASGHE